MSTLTTTTVAQAIHTCPMLVVILATILALAITAIIFPRTRATLKSTVHVANRAFALAIGRCFVAMLRPLIWLINRFTPVDDDDDDDDQLTAPCTQAPRVAKSTVAPSVTAPALRRPLPDLRQWRKDSFKKLKKEGYQSVFHNGLDDGY